MQIQTTLQNMPRSGALEARIRQDAAKLERFHPRITRCRIVLGEVEKHHQKGRQFSVYVEVRVPGHEDVVSTMHHHKDVNVALRDAFDSVRRRLEVVMREARGEVKSGAPHGRVSRGDR